MSSQSILPASWMQVLDRIQESLAETVRRTAEREQALPAAPADVPEGEDRWRAAFARLDDRLAALGDCADRAGRRAAEAEAALAGGVDDFARWVETMRAAARRLADRGHGAV